jgi:hypothetical protein
MRFLKKLKLELPHDSAIPLLSIYLKECKSGYNKDTCTPMFTAALFKLWNSLGALPTTDEWINTQGSGKRLFGQNDMCIGKLSLQGASHKGLNGVFFKFEVKIVAFKRPLI